MKLAESVPGSPAIREINYYNSSSDPWLKVYRHTDENKIKKMIARAKEMAKAGYNYKYLNPGFGPLAWCCVTFVSYLVYFAGIVGKAWVMGSNQQSYFWSPRYEVKSTANRDTLPDGDYNWFLRVNGFKAYYFKDVKNDLRPGDIVQSWAHTAIITEADTTEGGFDVANLPDLKKGANSKAVKTLQTMLNMNMGGYTALLVDGDFKTLTETRLKEFQRLNSLVVDGWCGALTWAKLLM